MAKITHESLVAEIYQVAADEKINPAELSRKEFRKLSSIGKSKFVNAPGNWGRAKSEACGDRVPLPAVGENQIVERLTTQVDKLGRTERQWIKIKSVKDDPLLMIQKMVANIEERVQPAPPIPAPPQADAGADFLAVYPLGDMHLGMYAAAREAGEDWNLDKAMQVAEAAIDDLTLYGPPAHEALLVNVGDFFHADGPSNTTPKSGHALSVDGRYFEIMEKGLELKCYMVDRLLQVHQTVRVWVRIGNHDTQSSVGLAIALRAYYRDNPRVIIEVDPSAADYLQFGRVLLGCTHGDTYKANKPEAMVAIMANDRQVEWGQTDHRYWFVGHVHHASRKEVPGGYVETFQTLAAKDAWHAREGYRSQRSMSRILIHRLDGEVSRMTSSVGRLRRLENAG